MISLPPELEREAFRFENDWAWPRRGAIRVLELLEALSLEVYSVEVWIVDREKVIIPSPIIYVWSAPTASAAESEREFAKRTCALARRYVAEFQWDEGDVCHQAFVPHFRIGSDAF